MAYASKYYDPTKAHEYYMRNRELKGYENRYGGSRGNGTSAASTGASVSGTLGRSSGRSNRGSSVSGTLGRSNSYSNRGASVSGTLGRSSGHSNRGASVSGTLGRSNSYSNRVASVSGTLGRSSGRSSKNSNSSNKLATSQNNNQKSKEAAMHIKNQMEKERNEVIKKINKDCDKEMLDSVKRLAADIKTMQKSGSNFNNKQFTARIKAMLGETKKKKIKAKRKHTANYKQKYKDEIDKLRSNKSMYSY